MISSLQNPRVRLAARLRERRDREQQQRYSIDGVRELSRALAAEIPLVEAFYCVEQLHTPAAENLLDDLQRRGVPLWEVTSPVMEKLAFGARVEGVLGIAQWQARPLSALQLPADPLVVVLEGIEKPGNLGAVLRSADAAGASAVIAADLRTDLYNPNAIRASLGTIFSVPVAVASSVDAAAFLRSHQCQILVALPEATQTYFEVPLTGPVALILGAEAEGVSAAWRTPATVPISLPMSGIADSLNVSVTAAVLLYEAVRQRTVAHPHETRLP